MKAVFLDLATVGSDEVDVSPLRQVTPDLDVFDYTEAHEVAMRIAGAAYVYINKVRMTREIIENAEALKFIGLLATGVDNVDLEAARQKGIAVCNIRAYCTNSVVEHVFSALLQLSHSTHLYHRSVRRGDWQKAVNFCMLSYPIREISAMTIGIVGHGNLGRGVEKIARAFGMKMMIARRPGTEDAPGDGRHDLDEVLQNCDVLTLHCPLTDATRGLIGRRELTLMKPSAILINTARGALVDSNALVNALQSGEIAAAAIDVLATEPPVNGDPILDYEGDNLLVTPHVAWATVEARQNAVDQLARAVRSFIEGGDMNRVV
jgi:glycerate dehydrogenase